LNAPLLIFFLLLLLLMMIPRQHDELEVQPFTEEFEELVRSVQGPLVKGESKLVEKNQPFNTFLLMLSNTFEQSENVSYRTIRRLASIMRDEVYLPKGAVVYFRAITTLLLREYQSSINTIQPHKRFKFEKYDGKGISGKSILAVLSWSGDKPHRWVKMLARDHSIQVNNELMKRLIALYDQWNLIIHPEDEIRHYHEKELEEGVISIDELVHKALDANRVSEGNPLHIQGHQTSVS
jgi:hypothetical protein